MKNTKAKEKFGSVIIQKLRDENYSDFLKRLEETKSLTPEGYRKQLEDSTMDLSLKENIIEEYSFLYGLDSKQKQELKKLILRTLDHTAFNFLREIEENQIDYQSIGLTFEGINIEDYFYKDFLSGTYFGEYFLWIEKFSKYGEFQN